MKYFILVVLLSVSIAAAISEGDIAFVEYNSDGVDDFKFLCLRDIEGGTIINFTDKGWLAAGEFRSFEGTITWAAQAEGVAAGTIVPIYAGATYSFGTISGSGSFALSTSGDQIIAYTGSIYFITAINNEGTSWQEDATSSNTSAMPTGLSSGTALALREADNAIYNGSILSGDASTISAAIHDPNNWIYSDSVPLNFDDIFALESLDVELITFTVKPQGSVLNFHWLIASSPSTAGFNIYSAQHETGPWNKLNRSPITAFPDQTEYQLKIPTIRNQSSFMLEAIDRNGHTERFTPIQLVASRIAQTCLPQKFHCAPAYPNPFNSRTCIPVQVDESQNISIGIYDLSGRKLKSIYRGFIASGEYHFFWEGTNQEGHQLPSGVYLLNIQAGGKLYSQKLTLLR